jgi:hypothetical protein
LAELTNNLFARDQRRRGNDHAATFQCIQLNQFDRDMSDRLTREAQSLREEIKEKNTDVRQTIEKMFTELSNVKTDRTLLASLFVEVAKCLNQDLGSKSVKGMGSEPMSGLAAGKNAL